MAGTCLKCSKDEHACQCGECIDCGLPVDPHDYDRCLNCRSAWSVKLDPLSDESRRLADLGWIMAQRMGFEPIALSASDLIILGQIYELSKDPTIRVFRAAVLFPGAPHEEGQA